MIGHKRSPLIIGHRGASTLAPENTLAAFARAIDDGADGIELDVRLSRDDVPVVIHDASLKHTGRRKDKVASLTAAQLQQIDVGSWFNHTHPTHARFQYAKQTVPTLAAVFELLATTSRRDAVIYVEMKTGRKRDSNLRLAEAVIDLIQRHKFLDRAVVISFNLSAVAAVGRLDPLIRTGALFGPKQRARQSARQIVSAAVKCGASEILLHRLVARRGILDLARQAELTPVVWTVDDLKWIQRARERGVHAIMTNNPGKMS